MISSSQAIHRLQEHRQAIQRFGVRRLGLFGSIAKGEERPDSDVDVLVDLEHNTFDAYMGLKFFLEDLLHCPVDLVLVDTIKPRLRDRILREVVDVPGF